MGRFILIKMVKLTALKWNIKFDLFILFTTNFQAIFRGHPIKEISITLTKKPDVHIHGTSGF